jgi:hypothetical protein
MASPDGGRRDTPAARGGRRLLWQRPHIVIPFIFPLFAATGSKMHHNQNHAKNQGGAP